jgi:hypothetical protein
LGWRDNLSRSATDFLEVVWPSVQELCGGGDIVPVEAASDDLKDRFDVLSGIDLWQCHQQKGMRGIASRIQWRYVHRGIRSFTIREGRKSGNKTELHKRIESFYGNGDWLFPALTIQAYLTDDEERRLLYCCIVRTRDLYAYLADRKLSYRDANDPERHGDNNIWRVVYVEDLTSEEIRVGELVPNGEQAPFEKVDGLRFGGGSQAETFGV